MKISAQFPDFFHDDGLSDLLQEILFKTGVPGIAAMISAGDWRAQAYAGEATLGSEIMLGPDSRFELSCLMKFFCAAIALGFESQGILDLDESLSTYLPELRSTIGHPIKVWHLLTHSSGYHGVDITTAKNRWGLSWRSFEQTFHQMTQLHPPGTVFNYEHSESVIIGSILERISGCTFQELFDKFAEECCDRRLGRRADISSHLESVSNHVCDARTGRFTPIGTPEFGPFWGPSLSNIRLTLNEIISITNRVMYTAMANSFSKDGSFRSSALRRSISLPKRVDFGVGLEVLPKYFGLGCALYADNTLGHNGSNIGQTCAVRFDPHRNVSFAVVVNSYAPRARDKAIEEIFKRLGSTKSVVDSSQKTLTPTGIEEYFSFDEVCGTYNGSFKGQVDISVCGHELKVIVGSKHSQPEKFSLFRTRFGYSLSGRDNASLGFFPHPLTGSPTLALGMHTYMKC